MRPEGIEPPAYRFEACRSIHLSYGRTRKADPRSLAERRTRGNGCWPQGTLYL